VAGYGFNTTGTIGQSFIGSTSGSAAIPLINGWNYMFAVAINDSGQVAGSGYDGTNGQAFVGTTSGSTAIPIPSGSTLASGYAINGSGQVAGTGSVQAFVGTTVGSTAIPLPGGFTSTAGIAINDIGQVGGWGYDGSTYQYFIGTASARATIPLPSGWLSAYGAGAINNSGQLAGYGSNGATQQAFIGTPSGSTPIPLPPAATTADVTYGSLNNSGVVVGYSNAGGWIWDQSTGTELLSALVPVGWDITDAISISNSGLILAEAAYDGGTTEYVELSQTAPEPSAGSLACGGLFLLVFVRRGFQGSGSRSREQHVSLVSVDISCRQS
jgi:hypothetical protein